MNAGDGSIDIEVQGQRAPAYSLHVTLTNRTGRAVTTYLSLLPWGGQYGLLLVAVKTDATGTLLAAKAPIDDPGPSTVTIEANQTLTGEVDLENRFPDLRGALRERDVVVFWSYQFQPVDEAPAARVGGYVLFPKEERKAP